MNPGSLAWFAGHEFRLAWRDWIAIMAGGRKRRRWRIAAALIGFATILHLLAFAIVARFAMDGLAGDKAALVALTGSVLLAWLLMVSQALEQVTRTFYARADLDLILSSPASARRVFAVRVGAVVLSTGAMSTLLAGPFINVLAFVGGPQWLAAYAVAAAMAATAVALALGLTLALFRLLGPKATRTASQILAAVIGAGFVIGVQVAAIGSYGSLSRFSVFQSETVVALAPDLQSPLWWPARAMTGDGPALAAVLAGSLVLLVGAIVCLSGSFGRYAVATADVPQGRTRRRSRGTVFRRASPAAVLRRKEWVLLRRDPWLISQSLMQILYLAPPALLLWRNFGSSAGTMLVVIPVLAMAAGQLAGGLAWLAVSGEDAPELVATAPIGGGLAQRAKVEAVLAVIAAVFVPFVIVLALASPPSALVAGLGIVVSAASAVMIQIWFRAQAKRSHFRRRQTSSRLATFAEALSSITWAATAALAAAGTWIALVPASIAVLILAGSRMASPAARAQS